MCLIVLKIVQTITDCILLKRKMSKLLFEFWHWKYFFIISLCHNIKIGIKSISY